MLLVCRIKTSDFCPQTVVTTFGLLSVVLKLLSVVIKTAVCCH